MEHGPKTISLSAPSVSANFGKKNLEEARTLILNDSPRAGQRWNLGNIFYSFPAATKSGSLTVELTEIEYSIELFIGGVLVAEQKVLETARLNEGSNPIHIAGSMEPFIPAVVFPGQGVEIRYRVFMTVFNASVSSGQGSIVVNYTLQTADHAR